MSATKILLPLIVLLITLMITGSYYFSDKQSSERQFVCMMKNGETDLKIIHYYLKNHQHEVDSYYDKALQIASLHDLNYLHEAVHHFTQGSIILEVATATRILEQLPSDSGNINHAAGRIYATKEFGHYDPALAVKHLEFAALHGDKNAAETLSILYSESSCLAEAITWAKVANTRDQVSECSKLPVDLERLTNNDWEVVVHNEQALEMAEKNKGLARLKYSANCDLNTELTNHTLEQ